MSCAHRWETTHHHVGHGPPREVALCTRCGTTNTAQARADEWPTPEQIAQLEQERAALGAPLERGALPMKTPSSDADAKARAAAKTIANKG